MEPLKVTYTTRDRNKRLYRYWKKIFPERCLWQTDCDTERKVQCA